MSRIDVRALVERTKVMGAWAYPELRHISELMALVHAQDDIEIDVDGFGSVTFSAQTFYLSYQGVMVLLRLEENGRHYMFMLDCMNIDFKNDNLRTGARITFKLDYDPATEQYGVRDYRRLKLAAVVPA